MDERQLQIGTGHGLFPLNWPMGLTTLRLLLLPFFLWIVLIDARHETSHGIEPQHLRWVAVGIFALMAITDKLDGYLARRLNQTSKIGALLDPLADKLLITCSVILLSFSWIAPPGFEIPFPVMLTIYGKDAAVVLGAVGLLSLAGRVQITPRPLGKASTALQLTLILATLLAADLQWISQRLAVLIVHGLWWIVAIVSLAACGDYAFQGAKQFQQYRQGLVAGKRRA